MGYQKRNTGNGADHTVHRLCDTDVYVADVYVSSPKYLFTALAKNKFGRNIKDTTSSIAKQHGAVLAVNGDFYGARNYGYVIRNGVLYRSPLQPAGPTKTLFSTATVP